MINNKNTMVAVYSTHSEAEGGVKALHKSGFDMKMLSIIGKDYHSDEHVVGYYNMGERMMLWGKLGTFWGGVWGLLFGSAFFIIPGLGPILVAGPLVTALIGALEGAVLVGGLSVLGASLYSIGIPKDSIVNYEKAIKGGKYIIVAHGTTNEVNKARACITDTKAAESWVHLSDNVKSKDINKDSCDTTVSCDSCGKKQ